MKPGEGSTVIGKSATFRGDLSSTEDLQVDGVFEGTIRMSSGKLTVGPDARVRASIAAPEVTVFGKVEGDIRATGRVELRANSVMVGDVFATRFSIEENAALRGYVDPSRAAEPIPAPAAVVSAKVPSPVAAPIAARPVPVAATTAGVLPTPRTPGLFNTQTGTPTHSSRQMPTALAAIAAAGLQEPSGDEAAAAGAKGDEAASS
jgi:cytoskeletal protein CcmA (bactofilin family)